MPTQLISPTDCYLADLERLDANAPLHDRRRVAFDRFSTLGFPTTRDEEWRHTSLKPFATTPFAVDTVVVRAIGTGEALKSASLYPSVAGEVVDVAFRAEQHIKKGAALLRLDDKHQRLAVRLAMVAEKETRRQLKRLEKLIPSGAASVSRLETAQTNLESASLRIDQARAALQDRTVYAPFDGIIGLTDVEKATGFRKTP